MSIDHLAVPLSRRVIDRRGSLGVLKCLTGQAESPVSERGKAMPLAAFASGMFPAASPSSRVAAWLNGRS